MWSTVFPIVVQLCCLIWRAECDLRVSAVRFYDPPNADPDGVTMGLVQAAYTDDSSPVANLSNWIPVCELSYYVCLPNGYF